MFAWLKNGIFKENFKRDRVDYLLQKIDLKNAQWVGVYALLVELCSEDDLRFLLKYFGCESTLDSLVTEGLITKIVQYKQRQEKEIK